MVTDDYDEVCWQFFCVCLGVLVVSHGFSIVFRWSLVSWWHFGGVFVKS